ncbi:MAG: NAD(P)-binding domain-containing protein [Nitriliruptorales bacterium]|nr:NAD(P)-binding domain-containing protein [Nitriliruptorales bacterium]
MPDTYAVIGAGPSGLAAGRALKRDDIPFVVYERHDGIGGMWDITNPGTPIYESAHFISSRTLSALDGLPFPEDYPDYPRHDQLLAYLREFARRFRLEPHVRLSTGVERIERRPEGGWTVVLDNGEEVDHAGVIMASGSQWTPNLPDYPGEWDGDAYHSKHYRSRDQLRDRRVLVVGAGNSGCDIACQAATAADAAAISTRRAYWIVPKHIFGQPTDVFARSTPGFVPGPVEQRFFAVLLRTVVGDLKRYGWPEPDHLPLATHPILNSEILLHLAHRDLVHRPDLERLEGDRVRFVDGTVEPYDLIIWATGYRLSWPYLDRDELRWPRPNDPGLFLNVFSRDHDDLFALGFVETDAGAWPHISLQADLISQVILDQHERPAQAARWRSFKQRDVDLEGGIEHADSPRHDYYVSDAHYRRYAAELLRALQRGELDEFATSGGAGLVERIRTRLVG